MFRAPALLNRLAGARNAMMTKALSSSMPQDEPHNLDDVNTHEEPHRNNANQHRRRAFNINRVELLGGVANDPVERVGRTGSAFSAFDVYTNVEYRRPDGSSDERVELHNVLVFGGMSNYVQKNVARGTRVFVSGRLHYSGGQLGISGSRLPRTACIVGDIVQPIAQAVGSGGGGGQQRD